MSDVETNNAKSVENDESPQASAKNLLNIIFKYMCT